MTTPTIDEAAEQTKPKERPEKARNPAPSPDATPREKLLWTPTPGEDATKILFPLSRSYAQARIPCNCGTELLVHWQARTGMIVGDHVVRCPNCDTSYDTPDQPLRLFRREGDDWTPVPLE
jgi:hypothetical protein